MNMNRTAKFTARIVPLQEVYKLTHKLALDIMKTDLTFDLVIAIARGGMLPARLICDFLNIGQLTSIQVKHYTRGAKQLEKAQLIDPVRNSLEGKKVLMIDDVNDSGKTLKAAYNHVKSKNPSLLKTAVLHDKENDRFKTDFVGHTLQAWKWLIYQWAVTEDVLEFLQKDDKLGKNPDEARNHLLEKYELKLDKELLRQILELKENYYG